MFRPMRRARQALPESVCARILARGTSGVLAVLGDEGYPYAVPLSYHYEAGRIIFHCARQGHKLDAIRRCPRASFCVIDQDRVAPEKYTTLYRSVIAFGTLRELTDEAEKRAAFEALGRKYAPHGPEAALQAEIDREWPALCVLEMTVLHLTGKQGRELAGRPAE